MISTLVRLCLLALALLLSLPLHAASLNDSVLEIPRGTVFELRTELEVPANRNFILLGRNRLTETFNELNQPLNQHHGRYYHYTDYLNSWQESVGRSYRECLERHRIYYSTGGGTGSSDVVISQGHGNTNIIINQSQTSEPSYGSYIGRNACIRPEHTIAVLMLDKEAAGAGGIFREGYAFRVKRVSHRRHGGLHTVTITFDHEVAKGIRIISTSTPEAIAIHHLQAQEYGDSFLSALGSALAGLEDIGGDYFDIQLPETRYFD